MQCVDDYTRSKYGLQATLTKLEYCRRSEVPVKHVDELEIMFAAVVGLILFVNIVGTTYDLKRDPDKKHKYGTVATVRLIQLCKEPLTL